MKTAFVYTMNVTQEIMERFDYRGSLNFMEMSIGRIFTPLKILYAYNTYQFDDYSKYINERFSEPEKALHKKIQFPIDCQNAFAIGAEMVNSDY